MRKAIGLAFLSLAISLTATPSRADWKVTQTDVDGDGHTDLVVENDQLTVKFAGKGGNILSLYDKIRQFENAKLFPNGQADGLAQLKLAGLTDDIEDGLYKLSTTPAAGALEVTATADVPLAADTKDAGFLRVAHRYNLEDGTTRVKVSTRIENHSGDAVNMVPWLKQLCFRGHGTAYGDMARVSFMTPYGVWDSEKPIPGRKGLRYDRLSDVHYLTASNWLSRTLQPTGPAANTLSVVVEPASMFKVYTWRKQTEDLMTEEVILAPREAARDAAYEFSYYLTLTPALTAPAYVSPLLNIEVNPHPLGLPSSSREITLRMAAVRDLGEVVATGTLKRLDAPGETQPVRAVFEGVNAVGASQAAIPVSLAAGGRYQLELQLTAKGEKILPGAEIGDKDPVVIPLVTDDELSTAIVYPSRAGGGNAFPRLAARKVSAPLLLNKGTLKVFRLATTQRAFETDTFTPLGHGPQQVQLYAGANEYQSMQVALVSSGDKPTTWKVSASPLRGPNGANVPVEHLSRFLYARTQVPSRYSPAYPLGNYPDALLPTDSIEVKPGIPIPLFVTYKTPQGAPAGDYKGEVTVGEGDAQFKVPVSLRVWNFELPVRPAIDMVAPTRQGNALNPIYFQYKLTPANLPVTNDLLAGRWEAVKKVMPELIAQGMSRTYLGTTYALLEKPGPQRLGEIDAFLKENSWLQYFYVRPGLDEASPDKLPQMEERLRKWKEVSSVATMENYYFDTGVEKLYGLMDIYSRPTVAPWMKERAQKGDRFWRVNAMPSALESDLPSLWTQYLRMADDGYAGSYLWTVSAWQEMDWGVDWWADPGVGNLEATLIWKHEGGYLPTIRLEALRDVIEGYTTYSMLKSRVGHPMRGDDPRLVERARAFCEGKPWQKIKTDADVELVRQQTGDLLSAFNGH